MAIYKSAQVEFSDRSGLPDGGTFCVISSDSDIPGRPYVTIIGIDDHEMKVHGPDLVDAIYSVLGNCLPPRR